jgi:putative ABC transport system permease protein
VGAVLVVKTMWNLLHLPLGLHVDSVLSAKVAPAADGKADPSRTVGFYSAMLQGLRQTHGIEAVGIINDLPLSGPGMTSNFLIPGHLDNEGPEAELRIVSPGYHKAMGISVLRGRDFEDGDTPSSQAVALVNAEAARSFFGNDDPIGREIQLDENSPKRVVIGMIASTRQRGVVDEFHPEVDLPYSQIPSDSVIYSLSLQQGMSVAIHSNLPLTELVSDVRNDVSSIDPTTAVFDFESMEEVVQHSVSGERFAMTVLVFFGLTALCLTAAGVYSVTAYLVARRTQEIGIRMALGATRGDILGMVLGHSMALIAIGVILGLLGFLFAGKALGSFLYHLSYLDVSAILGAALSLAFVGLLACCVPAWRAMATNPTSALRQL